MQTLIKSFGTQLNHWFALLRFDCLCSFCDKITCIFECLLVFGTGFKYIEYLRLWLGSTPQAPFLQILLGRIRSNLLTLINNLRFLKQKYFFFLDCKSCIIIMTLDLLWLWFPGHKLKLCFGKFCVKSSGMCLFNLSSTEHDSWNFFPIWLSFGGFCSFCAFK